MSKSIWKFTKERKARRDATRTRTPKAVMAFLPGSSRKPAVMILAKGATPRVAKGKAKGNG